MATASEIYFPSRSAFANVTHIFHTMRDNAAKRKMYRTTVSELSNLTNRELNDLGLSRSAIKGIAFEAAYGK